MYSVLLILRIELISKCQSAVYIAFSGSESNTFFMLMFSHVWLKQRHLFLKTQKPCCILKYKRRLSILGIWLAVCVGGFSSHWATNDINNIEINSTYNISCSFCKCLWMMKQFPSFPLRAHTSKMKTKNVMTLKKYSNITFRHFTETWPELDLSRCRFHYNCSALHHLVTQDKVLNAYILNH